MKNVELSINFIFSLLENVMVDEYGEINYHDHSITENSRVS